MNCDPSVTYTSPKNRLYKVIGMGKVPNTSKWFGRTLKSHYYTIIKFLDTNERSKLFHDYNGKIYDKEKI